MGGFGGDGEFSSTNPYWPHGALRDSIYLVASFQSILGPSTFPMQRRSDSASPEHPVILINTEDDDRDEDKNDDCPKNLRDFGLGGFVSAFCNASVVVSATVEADKKLNLFHSHKGNQAANTTVSFTIGIVIFSHFSPRRN